MVIKIARAWSVLSSWYGMNCAIGSTSTYRATVEEVAFEMEILPHVITLSSCKHVERDVSGGMF